MEQSTHNKQNDLQTMAEELKRKLTDFCESIPDSDARYFKSRFLDCISPLPDNIHSLGIEKSIVDKMRYYVLAEVNLDQCNDYLNLVEQLQYAETKHLVDELQKFRRFLNSSNKYIGYES